MMIDNYKLLQFLKKRSDIKKCGILKKLILCTRRPKDDVNNME
jgi:hypothetical protein